MLYFRTLWHSSPAAVLIGLIAVLHVGCDVILDRQSFAADGSTLVFSTYLGGRANDSPRDVAADPDGNIYITGGTASTDFPTTPGAYDTTHNGGHDVFVVKLGPSGKLIWATLLGGPGYDWAYGIEVDHTGSVTLAGRAGPGFPTTGGAFQQRFRGFPMPGYGPQNAFVARLKPDGSGLLFSTYSGTGEMHRDLAIDQRGDIHVILSYRHPNNGPQIPMPDAWLTNAYQKKIKGGRDSGIVKISGDGSRVLWATYFGGSADEGEAGSIRLCPNGDIALAGFTQSRDLPTTTGAHDRSFNGKYDWFVARFNTDGSQLRYATYVGGSGAEFPGAHNLEIDTQGNAYLASFTKSKDIPVTHGVVQPRFSGSFITKLSATGGLLACTYGVGGGPEGIAIDGRGGVITIGGPKIDHLPVTSNAAQRLHCGRQDAFIARFSDDLKRLTYGSYLGGPGDDKARAVCADSKGNLIMVGQTRVADWPVHAAAQNTYGGGPVDGFVAKFPMRH